MSKPRVHIKTFGCQMNVRDSEVVKGLLQAEGYRLVEDEIEADVILFNTCSVRQHAEDRVWSAVGKYRGKREEGRGKKKPIIGVIGCMAQNYKEEILKRAPQVDIVCGPSNIDNIALYLEEALRQKKNVVAVSERKRRDEAYHAGFYETKDHAYVVISEGCDNFCTYCVVPYVRGRLRHRTPTEILIEVKEAVDSGIVNITLLGQNVNSYSFGSLPSEQSERSSLVHRNVNFVDLLEQVSKIGGLRSLSFITSHPKDISKELFETMAQTPVIKKYLHLPVQSGSDRILGLMNRRYSVKKYSEIVDQYRSIVYNGKVSTDIIVGFPTERDEDFKGTFDLMRRIRFDSAYIFKYSPRPGTEAMKLKDDVLLAVKEKRHAVLLALQKEISKRKRTEDR